MKPVVWIVTVARCAETRADLVEKAQVKTCLGSFIPGCPAAMSEQLIRAIFPCQVLLKGVGARRFQEFPQ